MVPYPISEKSDGGRYLTLRHNRVAGARIERASGGYEPPEVPLLYPAIYFAVKNTAIHKYTQEDFLKQGSTVAQILKVEPCFKSP